MANSFCNYCHRLFYLFSILTTFSFLSFHFLKLPLFVLFQFMAYSLYSVFNFSHVLFHFISILTTISLLTFQFLTTCDWLLFNSCYVHFPSFWILATFTCWLQFAFFSIPTTLFLHFCHFLVDSFSVATIFRCSFVFLSNFSSGCFQFLPNFLYFLFSILPPTLDFFLNAYDVLVVSFSILSSFSLLLFEFLIGFPSLHFSTCHFPFAYFFCPCYHLLSSF